MQRHFKWDKKYLYWGVTAFLVIACAILFYMALRYLPALGAGMKALSKILSPFIWGLVITYLLSPMMKVFEKKLFKPFTSWLYKKNKKSDGSGMSRALAVVLSEIILLAILGALVYLILPQLYSSLETIVANSSTYINQVSAWLQRVLEDFPEIEQYAMDAFASVNNSLVAWIQSSVLPELGSLVTSVSAGLYYLVTGVYNLIIGIIVSIYIMGDLEGFGASAKRLLYCIFSVEAAQKIRRGLAFTDKTFVGFINGKLLDSAIIGLICYIGCAIMDMPYALLVSTIVGVTNVVPFFGPFIGAVPSALIILMVNPMKCLFFLIFVLILQQVDGNIIGPKILGTSIGINGFWVMFAIILGAGLFGFWGMLLGVPVFVVIHALVGIVIERKLKRSDLPWETADYKEIDHIDPVTHSPVKKVAEVEEDD